MGLRQTLARVSAGGAHVQVVEVAGQWVLRAGLERQIAERGWRLALSPADADVLAVCGVPGTDLAAFVERIWDQLPGPRVRVDVVGIAGLAGALDGAAVMLLDTASHVEDSRRRPSSPSPDPGSGDHDMGDHDMGDHDMGDHEMDDMDMAPGGIALAEGGEDRDGLEMDVLHVQLGPALGHWPAGLVLWCALQGDVIVDATASVIDGDDDTRGAADDNPAHAAARCSDAASSVLALAGWADAATAARRIRDLLLAPLPSGAAPPPSGVAPPALDRLEGLERKVRRSRILRWSLRGLGTLTPDNLRRRGLPDELGGDVGDRLLSTIGRAKTLLAGDPASLAPRRDHGAGVMEALPDLVTGLDLAAARLVVASLCPLEPDTSRPRAANG